MDYEKAYKEALERAKEEFYASNSFGKGTIEYIFPELAESEDERIRKDIIVLVKDWWDRVNKDNISTKETMIAWLEKQGTPNQTSIWKHWKDGIAGNGEGKPIYLIKYGRTYSLSSCLCFECDYIELSELDKLLSEKQSGQKPADKIEPKFKVGDEIKTANEESLTITKVDEKGYWSKDLFICSFDEECIWDLVEQNPTWSEEDREYMESLLDIINGTPSLTPSEVECHKDWLKSLKNRVVLQPKQEWSKEDIQMYRNTLYYLSEPSPLKEVNGKSREQLLDWLKSIKDRYTWKPSDEQMHYLNWIANIKLGDSVVEQEVSKRLNELLEQLKKLKGEEV